MRASLLGSVRDITRSWSARRSLRRSAEKRLYSAVAVIQDLEPRQLLSVTNLFPTNGHPNTASGSNNQAGIPVAVAVGDLNGDGVPDVAMETQGGYVQTFLQGNDGHGKGNGKFYYQGSYGLTFGGGERDNNDLVVGQLPNGDPFIAAAMTDSEQIDVLLGDGAGHIVFGYIRSPGFDVNSISAVINDKSGPTSGLSLFVGGEDNGNGYTGGVFDIDGYGDAVFFHFSTYTGNPVYQAATADFEGDGATDFVANTKDGLYIFDQSGPYQLGYGSYETIAVGNLNPNTSADDLVALTPAYRRYTGGYYFQSLEVFIDGPGGFTQRPNSYYATNLHVTNRYGENVQIADVNGDGKGDLLVTDQYNDVLGFKGNGNGSFTTPVNYYTGSVNSNGYLEYEGRFADMNGDGKADLVFTYYNNDNYAAIGVLENTPSVTSPPAFTTTDGQFDKGARFTEGTYGSFSVSTTGSPAPTITLEGDGGLPGGLTFVSNTYNGVPDGTATIYGTPSATDKGGQYQVTLVATDASGYTSYLDPTITIYAAPKITSSTAAEFNTEHVGSFNITTTGFPTAAITYSGSIDGLTFQDNGNGTATISGVPAAGTGGDYPIVITASNVEYYGGAYHTVMTTQDFELVVDQAPAIVVPSLPGTTFTAGDSGGFTITTTGFPTDPTLSIASGNLPSGLTFTDNGDGTATVTGTLGVLTGGTYDLTVKADNGVAPAAYQSFVILVEQAPAITSPDDATFTVGSAGSFVITTTGFPTATTSVTAGTLPAGLILTDNGNGTATISGTPTAPGGPDTVTLTATNGVSPDATQTFTLTVDQTSSVTTTTAEFNTGDVFTVGSTGSFTFSTSGSPMPAIGLGSPLPPGLTFTDNGDGTATISGTPAAGTGGSYEVVITLTNSEGTVTVDPPLIIDQAPVISSADAATFTVGQPGTFTVTTTGFPTASFSLSPAAMTLLSNLGLTFTDNGNGTATLSGTPNANPLGLSDFSITASNIEIISGTPTTVSTAQEFFLTVDQAPAFTSVNFDTVTAPANVGAETPITPFVVTTSGFPILGGAEILSISSGALPAGLVFTDFGNGTAAITGTLPPGTGGTYNLTLEANNGVAPAAYQNFTLTVDQAPAITSAADATFTVSSAGSFVITTTGFPTATTSVTAGTLPAGLILTDNGNGTATISGTPTAPGGTDIVTLTATNGVSPDATQVFTLTVAQSPAFTSGNTATLTAPDNVADEVAITPITITTSGFPILGGAEILNISSGTLPTGLIFTDNGDGTATISGTLPPATGGSYDFTIEANNNVAPPAYQNFTLVVDQAPIITSTNGATFFVGSAGTFTVTTTGFPNPTISETPIGATLASLGLTFHDNGNGTATISGEPTVGDSGTYTYTITADNGVAPADNQTFTLNIDQYPTFTSGNTATLTAPDSVADEVAITPITVTTTGFPILGGSEKIFITSGTLPKGLIFTDNGDGTATISGTLLPATGGTYNFTIEANNNVAPPAFQNFTLIVDQAPVITSTNGATFYVGSAGSFTVTTTGFPNPAITQVVEGSNTTTLADLGLSFHDNGDGTATISGQPTAGDGGNYTFTITADNGVAPAGTQVFTLNVDQYPSFTSSNTATLTAPASVGAEVPITPITVTTFGFPILGGSEKIFITSGTLPTGLIFTDNGDGTATISGTLLPATGGSYEFTIEANNNVAPPAFQNFTLIVDQAPVITSTNGATFTVGAASSFTITTTGFPNPAISQVIEGANSTTLAALGLSFHDNGNGTATISGAPLPGTGGAYTYTITADNGVSPNGTQVFTLIVDQPPAFTSADTVTVTVGTAMTPFTITTTGFPLLNPELSIVSGTLPGGLFFANSGNGTATITGTPDALTGGTYSLTIEANNNVAPPAYQTFILIVDQAPAITSTNNTTFTVGSAGSFLVTTTGYPIPITSVGAGLPAGVSLHDNGNGTAILSGTPAAGTGGIYVVTLTASNGVSPNATQSFTLTVDQAPAFTSSNTATVTAPATVGAEAPITPITITTSGFPILAGAEKLSIVAGFLPSNLLFTDNGNSTATISGTLIPQTGGTYNFTIEANNNVAPPAYQTFTLIVDQAPQITSENHVTFAVGITGTFTVTTTGFPVPAITETPIGVSLASLGLTFQDNHDGTATLSGTPLAGTGGSYTYTITANNGVSPNATQTLTVIIDQLPAFTNPPYILTLPNVTDPSEGDLSYKYGENNVQLPERVFDSFDIDTSGYSPDGETVSLVGGALPKGMSLVDNGDGTATVSGTPRAPGLYHITVETDYIGVETIDESIAIRVESASSPKIVSASSKTLYIGSEDIEGTQPGTAGFFTFKTTGFPKATLSLSGTVPEGSGGGDIETTADGGTLLADIGLPDLTFTDNGDGTATLSGSLQTDSDLPNVYVFTLDANNGIKDVKQTFTLKVEQAIDFYNPTPTDLALKSEWIGTPLDTGTVGDDYEFDVLTNINNATNLPKGTLHATGLPKGLKFTDNGDGTGTITGTPTKAGTYSVTITAKQDGQTQKIKSTLVINDPPGLATDSVSVSADKTFSKTIKLTGGPGPISVDQTSIVLGDDPGELPDGLTLTTNGSKTNPELILKGTVGAGSYSPTFDLVAADGTTTVVTLDINAA